MKMLKKLYEKTQKCHYNISIRQSNDIQCVLQSSVIIVKTK